MSSVLFTALSGLNANRRMMGVTGHNVANANTNKFKKQRVVNSESATGGVNSTIETVNTPGPKVVDTYTGEVTEKSNVDLVDQMVNMIMARRSAQANTKVIDVDNEIVGTVIDSVV
jgi:flagellar basal body rod protein FlgG